MAPDPFRMHALQSQLTLLTKEFYALARNESIINVS